MKKLVLMLLVCSMVLSSVFTGFAWEDEDVVDDNGQQIIVPLQKPTVKVSSIFALDETTAGPDGTYGNVYKGKVNAAKANAENLMATLTDYAFNPGTYKLSVWFMEDAQNADIMTRMIRPKVGNDTIKQGSTYLFFNDNRAGITPGVWKKATLDFEVNETDNAKCLGKPSLTINWECAGQWDSVPWANRDSSGDFYIYFSDIQLMKYPKAPLSLVGTNDGTELTSEASAFAAEFSVPPAPGSIETVTINGKERNAEDLDIRADENTLYISAVGGFAPGKSYQVSVSGVKDVFGREYREVVSGVVKAKEYLDVRYQGMTEEQASFSITNQKEKNVDCMITIFYYRGNSVTKVFNSQPEKGIEPGQAVTVSVPVSGDLDGLTAKAWIWDCSGTVPTPLSVEIAL